MEIFLGTADPFAPYPPAGGGGKERRVLPEDGADRGARVVFLGRRAGPPNSVHMEAFHKRLEELGVRHHYDAGLKFAHDGRSGWVPRALEALLGIVKAGEGER